MKLMNTSVCKKITPQTLSLPKLADDDNDLQDLGYDDDDHLTKEKPLFLLRLLSNSNK